MRDFCSAMRLELHRNHIEPNIGALTRVALDVTHGHALQGELFAPCDHLLGLPKLVLGLGFNFDEHQGGIIPCDNIDFAVRSRKLRAAMRYPSRSRNDTAIRSPASPFGRRKSGTVFPMHRDPAKTEAMNRTRSQ